MSTAVHADTELATVFVHDAYPGGAGFAERGYEPATIRDIEGACAEAGVEL